MCRVCRCGGSTGSAVQSFTGTFLAECLPAPQQEWLERCLQPSRQGAGEREAQLAALNSRIEGHKQVVTKALARKRLLHKFADSPMDAVKSALSLQSRCLEVTRWPGCGEWVAKTQLRCFMACELAFALLLGCPVVVVLPFFHLGRRFAVILNQRHRKALTQRSVYSQVMSCRVCLVVPRSQAMCAYAVSSR